MVPFEVLLMKPALLKPACKCFRGMKVPDNESRRILRSYQLVCEKPLPSKDVDDDEETDDDEEEEADVQEEADVEEEADVQDKADVQEEASVEEARVPKQPLVPAEASASSFKEANENNAAASGATGELPEEHNLGSSASRSPQDDNNYSCHRNCGNADAWENMVGCNTEHAPDGRWYHLTCAGLTAAPEEEGRI